MSKYIPRKHGSTDEHVYHTDPDCYYVTADHRQVPDEYDTVKGLRECKYCSDDMGDRTNQCETCMFCGASVYSLRNHLPCEEAP